MPIVHAVASGASSWPARRAPCPLRRPTVDDPWCRGRPRCASTGSAAFRDDPVARTRSSVSAATVVLADRAPPEVAGRGQLGIPPVPGAAPGRPPRYRPPSARYLVVNITTRYIASSLNSGHLHSCRTPVAARKLCGIRLPSNLDPYPNLYPNWPRSRLLSATFADVLNALTPAITRVQRISANLLDQSGGQVVAGPNPVSPTQGKAVLWLN